MVRLHRFVKKPSSQRILISCFFIVLTLLIGQTIANVKDINDTWILADIFPLFLLLTIIYVATVSFSINLKVISILTSIYLVTLNLIPQLKYVFVYGFFDPLAHYQFIQELTRAGHVPDTGYYAAQYGGTPGSHIFVSELSIVTGLDPLVAFKFFLAVSPLIIPLAVYLVLKKLSMPIGLSKIILMSTAITSPVLYKFNGTVAIFSLYVLFIYLSLLVAYRGSSTRLNFAIVTLVGIRIIISHDVTSFFLTICLLSVLILHFFGKPMKPLAMSGRSFVSLVMTFVVMSFVHFAFASNFNLATITLLVRDSIVSLFGGKSPGAIEYYTGFYELTLLEKVPVLAVRIGGDVISLFLSILAPLAMLRLKLKANNIRRFYYVLAVPATLALWTLLLTMLIRPRIVSRGLIYFAAFSPFLVGITIYWFINSGHYRYKNVILVAVVFCLISISLIQFYPCQPLIPKVSTSYSSYYVMDLRAANSIHQRSMVHFINVYNPGLSIATDPKTRDLIYSLSEPSIHALVTHEDPLEKGIEARLILVSSDENALIILSGRQAIEYFQGVQSAIKNNSIIYTNGKSCILLNFESH